MNNDTVNSLEEENNINNEELVIEEVNKDINTNINNNEVLEIEEVNNDINNDEVLEIAEVNNNEKVVLNEINTDINNNIDNINNIDNNENIDVLEIDEDNNKELDSNKTNITPEKRDNKPITYKINKRYHGYEHHITTYIIVFIILITVFIIFSIGYNFSKNETLQYNYNSKANYQVCLRENDYYKEKCLDENTEYISSITDKINIDFNYSGVYQDTKNRNLKYYIKSVLLIKTDTESSKELYKDEDKLTKEKKINFDKNVVSFNETVSIPFGEYNNYAAKYKNEYSLIGKSTLDVSLIVKENGQEKEVSKVTIPLTELTYNITKQESNNKVETYEVKSSSNIKYLFMGLLALTVLIFIYAIYRIIRFVITTLPKESKYNKKLRKILNVYDRVIITLEDKNTIVNDTEVYTVKTFLELLDVRDTIDKPILYYKVNDIKTEFYVQDINKTYKYVMKESDFEDKK